MPIDRTVISGRPDGIPGLSFDDEFSGRPELATNCPSGPETAWAENLMLTNNLERGVWAGLYLRDRRHGLLRESPARGWRPASAAE